MQTGIDMVDQAFDDVVPEPIVQRILADAMRAFVDKADAAGCRAALAQGTGTNLNDPTAVASGTSSAIVTQPAPSAARPTRLHSSGSGHVLGAIVDQRM